MKHQTAQQTLSSYSSQVLLLGDKQKFVSCFLTLAVEVVKITIKYQ